MVLAMAPTMVMAVVLTVAPTVNAHTAMGKAMWTIVVMIAVDHTPRASAPIQIKPRPNLHS